MRVLVTGGSGFIGSHLANKLLSQGHSVTVIDKVITNRIPEVEYIEASLIDPDLLLNNIVSKHDYIFHLAALVGMKNGIYFPYESMKNNLDATVFLMNACTTNNKPIFFASTSEVYGTNSHVPLSESSSRIIGETWNNRWGYSESKAIAERLLILEHMKSGLDVRIGRFFNVAGPGQSGEYGMVMPRFVNAAMSNKPLIIYGTGNQTRSFCHIDDAIDGMLKVALDGIPGEVYNIGNPEEISMNGLADLVIKTLGSFSGVRHIPYEDVYPGYVEIERRVPNINKIKKLGWAPKLSLKQIIIDIAQNG